jgi:hypothetical protein
MGSVWLAIIYIGGWILSMRVFGYFWKNRKLGEYYQYVLPPSYYAILAHHFRKGRPV